MTIHNHTPLCSTEVGSLWTQYQNDSLAVCILKHMLQNIEDTDIKEVVQFALQVAENNLTQITSLLAGSQFPIPKGFTQDDINLNGPRIFLDAFYLYYLKHMSRLGLAAYSLSLSLAARGDIRNFYQNCLHASIEIDNKVTSSMLSKGIYIRAPYIPPDDKIEFVSDSSYLGSIFGKKRLLNAIEIGNLFSNLQANIIGEALMTAFAQVVTSQAIREYLLRGKEIANKHVQLFSASLKSSDLPAPSQLNTMIAPSTTAPFSDKLILFHVTVMIAAGIGNYGLSMSTSQRMDLTINYARLLAEIGLYAEDGANLMISHKWMEEPPQTINRKELALSSKK
ncbi:MAG: hypothetical protein K0Q75_2467 [Anaerospora sp.]|nr:hypothetical protein [Anaerospora sp.]